MCHPGCLGGMCSFPRPLPLARCSQSSRSSRSSCLFSFFLHDALHKWPWRATLIASVGALVASPAWWHSWFVLTFVTDFGQAWVAFFRRIFLGEHQSIFTFQCGLWGHPFFPHQTSSDTQLSRLEVMEQMLLPSPPPSPSDDLKPPPPTAVAESQWGEPRLEAIGTGACVAGSISLWPVLLPPVGNH